MNNPPDGSLEDRLIRACVAGCTCQTKTPEITYHDGQCHYRLFWEAAAAIRQGNVTRVDQHSDAAMVLHLRGLLHQALPYVEDTGGASMTTEQTSLAERIQRQLGAVSSSSEKSS